jgi:hypothetical protein
MNRKAFILAGFAVIAVAMLLRIWGIHWGLPTPTHYFSYHPDETVTLIPALRIDFLRGHLNPGFYNYGSLFIYLTNLSIICGSLIGLIHLPESGEIFSEITEFAKLYLAGRVVAVLLGILTVYLVYLLGKRAYSQTIGLVAALFMAVLPIHVMHSHYLAVDVPATFFVAATLVFAVSIPTSHKLHNYILAGLFSGLAAGTKYNTGIVVIAPLVAHLASAEAKPFLRIFSPKLIALLASSVVGFLIGTPGALLYKSDFLAGFLYELKHAATGHGLVFANTPIGLIYHFTHSLLPGMGLPLLILAVIGVLYALTLRKTADLTLLAFLLTYYIMIGVAQVKFARYTIPILPVLTVFAARAVCHIREKVQKGNLAGLLAKSIFTVIIAVAVTYTLAYALTIDWVFSHTDTRDAAASWIHENVPKGMSIGLPTCPWFYTPPLDPMFGLPDPDDRRKRTLEFMDYVLIISDQDWNAKLLEFTLPDYVVMSEFEYYDPLRLKDSEALSYFKVLKQKYYLEKEFKSLLARYSKFFTLNATLPHDMAYASPTIRIYALKVE